MQEFHERLGALLMRSSAIGEAALNSALAYKAEKPYLRIGEILLGRGLITLSQLEDALERQHRSVKLGQLLLRRGVITIGQLDAALARQSQGGGLLGEILIEQGACTNLEIQEALSYQMHFVAFGYSPNLGGSPSRVSG